MTNLLSFANRPSVYNKDIVAKLRMYDPYKLRIHHVFSTLQGEGPYAGRKALFIRLAGCNRGSKTESTGCAGCDTAFAFDHGVEYDENEFIATFGEQVKAHDLIVVTGGEPGLQWSALNNILTNALATLNHHFATIQIETNGDFALPRDCGGKWDWKFVISPKGIHDAMPSMLKHMDVVDADIWLKFLIEDIEGSIYYDIPKWMVEATFDFEKVYLSPVTAWKSVPGEIASFWEDSCDLEQTKKNMRRAAKLCMECGAKLSLQTHLFYGFE